MDLEKEGENVKIENNGNASYTEALCYVSNYVLEMVKKTNINENKD